MEWRIFFIAKYDPQGVLQWTRNGGGLSDDGINMECSTDLNGNTFVALHAYGNVQFGTTNLNNNSGELVILKYDNNGNQIFAKSYGSSGLDVPAGLEIDSLGNFYVTGYFNDTIFFGPISVV